MAVDNQTRNKRINDWKRDNTDRLNFSMKKGKRAEIQAAADFLGVTASEFVRQAIDEKIEKTLKK